MEKFVINPLEGILQAKFGQTREDVRQNFSEQAVEMDHIDNYFEGQLLFHYDGDDKLDFIEFVEPYEFEVELFGTNPFSTKVSSLLDLCTQNESGDLFDAEQPLKYYFLGKMLSFYRDASEQDILNGIEEAKQDGTYDEDKDWFVSELEKYSCFQAVGFGNHGYYTLS